MNAMDDWELLQLFAKNRSETAFAELVRRHLNWVYSLARRHVGDAHLAEDVAQSVFVLLARKAASLRRGTVLTGWLFHATRYVASCAIRAERRRRVREESASAMNTSTPPDENDPVWNQLTPHLDQAVAALSSADRTAILLRFYEKKPLREVGEHLGLTEEAAKKRVSHAIEKLRDFMTRRGVVLGGAGLIAVLAEQTVQAAPVTLATAVVKTSMAGASASGILPQLARETLNAWRWAKLKLVASVAVVSLTAVFLTLHTAPWRTRDATPRFSSDKPVAAAVRGDGAEATPRRTGDSGPLILDIARFYRTTNNRYLQSVQGRQVIDGLPFQIDGEAILYGKTQASQNNSSVYQDAFTGIRINRAFDELHLIHATKWPDVEGQIIARIRLNYADGTRQEFPVTYGGHVRDWFRLPSEEKELLTDHDSKIVWRGPGDEGLRTTSRLFASTLRNPEPQKVVESMDVVSTRSLAAYDLLAATVANADPNRPLSPPNVLDEPERNFDGQLAIRAVDQATGQPVAGALVDPYMTVDEAGVVGTPFYTSADGEGVVHYPIAKTTSVSVTVEKDDEMGAYLRGSVEISNPKQEERTIIMNSLLRVRGPLVDAESGQPVAKATIIRGTALTNPNVLEIQPRQVFWTPDVVTTNGMYQLTFDADNQDHFVRIEAEGYKTTDSRAFKSDEGDITFDFRLQKEDWMSGVVRAADGSPAKDAKVYLVTGGEQLPISNGRASPYGATPTATAGADGRFALPQPNNSFLVAAVDERGYAETPLFSKPSPLPDLILSPWGRIEGEMRVGGKAAAGQKVAVQYTSHSFQMESVTQTEVRVINSQIETQTVTTSRLGPMVSFNVDTNCDSNGRFEFNFVLPGKVSVGRSVALSEGMWVTTHTVTLQIKPGVTAHVVVGGTGQAVIGRVVAPAEVGERIDWSRYSAIFHTKLPQPNFPDGWQTMTDEQRRAWFQQWINTDEGRAYKQATKAKTETPFYPFALGSDGAFRVEDMPSGDYELYVATHDRFGRETNAPSGWSGELHHEFTVPEMPDGRSDEPLDLGELQLEQVNPRE